MTRKMKDSGIERIGEIPEDWEIVPLKNVSVEFYSGGTPTSSVDSFYTDKETGYPFINISDLTNKKEVENIEKHITKLAVQSKNLKLINNDYVLLAMYASTGTVSLLSLNSYISQAILAIKPNKMLDKEFLYYFLYSFKPYSVAYSRGTTQNNLNADIVKNIKISLPDIKKQQSIVNILNRKILKLKNVKDIIDNEIEILEEYKKSLITEAVTKGLNPDVEMKDSGIEWIGEIPKHWEQSKIKYIFKVISGSTPDSSNASFWDGDIKRITPADMKDTGYIDTGSRFISKLGYLSCGTTILPKGSIVISSRAPIGKINYTYDQLCTNQGCKGLVRDGNNKYFYYLLVSSIKKLQSLGRGTTFLELSTNYLNNLNIINPPIIEQQEIVSYLDEKCKIIDDAINKKNQQVEILEDYKKSLIYEYVTGKKEVPHA